MGIRVERLLPTYPIQSLVMKHINDLPLECLSSIAEHLDLPDVMTLLATSKQWNLAINSNEATVYRCLAGKHDSRAGFTPSSRLPEALRTWASPHVRSITTWEQYCKVQVATEQRWRGKPAPTCTLVVHEFAQTQSVQNIRIDLEKSLIVTTETRSSVHPDLESPDMGSINRIAVRCLLDPAGPALFCLDTSIPIYQLELSNGYVVSSHSEGFSIWRWAVDQQQDHITYTSTQHQTADKPTDPTRGQLVSIGKFSHPNNLFRFVYPTLCAAGPDCQSIQLWDIPSCSLIQTIATGLRRESMVLPTDLTDTHVFAALDNVFVYSRQTGQLVFQLDRTYLEKTHYNMKPPVLTDWQRSSNSWFEKYALSEYRGGSWKMEDDGRDSVSLGLEEMSGVHVSPSGRDFIATTRSGRIIRVDFTSPIPESNVSHYDSPTWSQCRVSATKVHEIRSVAYDGKRIAILGCKGLSILYMNDQPNTKAQGLFYPFPATSMLHIPLFPESAGSIPRSDGLELTRDMCWFSCVPTRILRRHDRRVIGVVDFAKEREVVSNKSNN
ncbi:unnamed protein product [Rhizoctonia solani]|uniref:F-box domain-containing protein n=1 Tax=Rhizoctonia solani TaxID=456999 RepID=A0A8H3DXM5_9AGAM|nr:unnamed protein product [Rhizoctonia solani]